MAPVRCDAVNIFAYDITTGNRVPSFSPHPERAGLVVTAATRREPVSTSVGTSPRSTAWPARHVAAFDVATGALVDFNARTDGQVRGFGFSGDTVYVGGNFRSANGQAARSARLLQRGAGRSDDLVGPESWTAVTSGRW